jgi:hypothetical protein
MKKYQFGYRDLTIPEIVDRIWSQRNGDNETVIAPNRSKIRLLYGASYPYAPISLLKKVGIKYKILYNEHVYGYINQKSELEKLVKWIAKTDKKFTLHLS